MTARYDRKATDAPVEVAEARKRARCDPGDDTASPFNMEPRTCRRNQAQL
jgi:hypothetical protein